MLDINLKKALVFLNRSRLSSLQQETLRSLLATVKISELLDLAQDNACQVLVYKNIRRYGLNEIFEACYAFTDFKNVASRFEERAERRADEARRFLQACADAKLPVVLLKGSMLGSAIYQDHAYKKMNDIDFLVHPDSVPAVMAVMERCGFRSVGKLFAEYEMDLKRNHHLSPYVNRDNSCVLGLHWHLTSPYSQWKPDFSSLWAEKVPMIFHQDTPAFRLSWEHNLAHLCMHLPFYKLGLRELADVFNVIFDQTIDWVKFIDYVQQWKIQDPTWRVLSLARAWSDSPIPPEVFTALTAQVQRNTREDTVQRLKNEYRLMRSRSVYIGKIEKAFGLFRLSPLLLDRAKALAYIWFKTLWVSQQEIPKLLALSERDEIKFKQSSWWQTLLNRMRATGKIWNAMARDYGHAALVFMVFTNFYILLQTLLKAPFPPYGQDNLSRLKELQTLLE